MLSIERIKSVSGARAVASLFGVLAGIGGITHGVGEVLQGNVPPGGIFILSWNRGPIFTNMGGDPGMTLAPTMLAAGILTFAVSTAVVVWSAAFVNRKHGGRVLIGLSMAMMLAGGGFGAPLIGLLAGSAGTMINAPLSGWRQRLGPGWQRFLARLWPWSFGVAAISGSFLVLGALILVGLFGLGDANLYLNAFYLTVASLLATVLLTPAYDLQRAEDGRYFVGTAQREGQAHA